MRLATWLLRTVGLLRTSGLLRTAGLLGAAAVLAAADPVARITPITDETIRQEALAKLVSGMFTRYMPGQAADTSRTIGSRHPLGFPDAFAGEKVYYVTGNLGTSTEMCASANEPPSKALSTRELRFQLYQWPVGAPSELLAVVQYRFPQARPAFNCTSLGFLAHLTGEGTEREVLEITVLDAWRHYAFQSVQLVDLTGDGIPELAIESDSGDGVQTSSHLYIYDLSEGYLHRLFTTTTRWHSEPDEVRVAAEDDVWTQTLDVARTLHERGKRFCFEKTAYADSGKWFPSPKVSRPCYAPKSEE
jgi:hypothetical protein